MATVTGLTAARMLDIEAASIVGGAVNQAGRLILTTHNGVEIDAGDVIGPQGETGADASVGINPKGSGDQPSTYPLGISSFMYGYGGAQGFPAAYGTVFTFIANATRGFQIVVDKNTSKLWFRTIGDDAWSAFFQVALQSDVTALQARMTTIETQFRSAELTSTTDLNDLQDSGTYTQSQSAEASYAKNYPVALAGVLEVQSNHHNGGMMAWQRYTPYGSLSHVFYTRGNYNGTWYGWRRFDSQASDDTGWIPIVLENGWVNYGGSYANASYRVMNRVVYVVGLIKNGTATAGTRIGKLPDNLGQIGNSIEDVLTYGGTGSTPPVPGRIDVESDGALTIRGTVNTNWVALSPRPWPVNS